MFIPPHKRSKTDKAYIENLFRNLHAFKRFPNDVRDSLAEVVLFQYVPPERTIIKQTYKAKAMYFVARGNLQMIKDTFDEVTGNLGFIVFFFQKVFNKCLTF